MKIAFTSSILLLTLVIRAQTPILESWIINQSSTTGYNGILSNVLSVSSNNQFVYVSANSIPAYTIGPWTANPNSPSAQNFIFKLTRTPEASAQPVATGLGHIGVWKNGVSIFNAKDAFSYNNQGVWNQNAIIVEGISFDECLGHPAPNGEYHTHLNPVCLYDFTNILNHAPILGYAFDGFPIYGAYAFANPDGSGSIIRMRSSYQLRDITTRTTLADGTLLAANQYGPAVSIQYPLGYYLEDFEYVDGLGDLDEHNGRFCITPEYPEGIYCYFATLNEEFEASYPYVLGPRYYGVVTAGNTGPQGGHNVIPGDAVVYTPTSINENESSKFIGIITSNENWIFKDLMPHSYEVYNSSGQRLLIGKSSEINNSNLANGMYFISVKEEDGKLQTTKVVR